MASIQHTARKKAQYKQCDYGIRRCNDWLAMLTTDALDSIYTPSLHNYCIDTTFNVFANLKDRVTTLAISKSSRLNVTPTIGNKLII